MNKDCFYVDFIVDVEDLNNVDIVMFGTAIMSKLKKFLLKSKPRKSILSNSRNLIVTENLKNKIVKEDFVEPFRFFMATKEVDMSFMAEFNKLKKNKINKPFIFGFFYVVDHVEEEIPYITHIFLDELSFDELVKIKLEEYSEELIDDYCLRYLEIAEDFDLDENDYIEFFKNKKGFTVIIEGSDSRHYGIFQFVSS